MRSSFNKNLHKAFSLSVIMLLMMAGISYVAIRESHDRAEWVHHTEIVIDELEHLISQMKDAETGVRGFIITSDPETLEPYHGSYSRTLKHYKSIEHLTEDNEQQQRSLPLLRQKIEEKYQILNRQISLTKNGQTVSHDMIREGKIMMDQARVLVKTMQNRESNLLKERTEKWRFFSTITPLLIVLVTMVSVATSYYFCSWLKRTYYKKTKLRQLLQRQNIAMQKRIKIVENIADKIAGGNYHIRLA